MVDPEIRTCCMCPDDIPKNRSRYKTCSKKCAEARKVESWKEANRTIPDPDSPKVKMTNMFLLRPCR